MLSVGMAAVLRDQSRDWDGRTHSGSEGGEKLDVLV
jgi:hypothetical protein